jgi:5-amino-6-(5-phosphoribosylamino)uracil reductase/diaminohydroxyphosphoribosylaminopyrimidine deaminase/5-amino-6-(5-phosphoribosylamino)uracil reductase
VLFESPGHTLVATTAPVDAARRAALEARGARVLAVTAGADKRVDPLALLRALVDEGVRSVLVEGGAEFVTTLLRTRLVHRLVVCVAPKLLGAGVEAVGDLGITRLAEALTFRTSEFRPCGVDVLFEGDLAGARAPAFPAPEVLRAGHAG